MNPLQNFCRAICEAFENFPPQACLKVWEAFEAFQNSKGKPSKEDLRDIYEALVTGLTLNETEGEAEGETETKDSNLPRFIQEFPKVAPEILESWLDSFPEIPAEEVETIIPEFFFELKTPALPGDNPVEVSNGVFTVGEFFDIEEAYGAAQKLYFEGRAATLELCEASE